MRRHFTTFSLAVIFFLALSPLAQGQRGSLSGRVTDQAGRSLAGASIFLHDIKVLAVSDTDGRYLTAPIVNGDYLIEVTYQGYSSSIQHISIKGETVHNFILSSTVVEQEAVTVTGVSSATRLKFIPQSVSVVKRADLLQTAAPNLIASLTRVGGVSMISTGPAIAKPVIRGLGYNRVITVNDGVRQEGQQWGDEHGIEIDELSVKKVEILKGPASLMYGSDGLAGVINISTNQPVTPGTFKANLLSGYTDNNNQFSQYADFSGHLTNGFSWNVYGSGKSAADYRNGLDGRVLNSRFREANAGGYIGLNRPWGYSHLVVSSFNQKLGVPEGVRDSATGRFIVFAESPLESIANNEQLKSRDLLTPFQQINHFKVASDNSFAIRSNRLSVLVAYQRNLRREFADPTAVHEPELFFDLQTINYNVQLHMAPYRGWKTSVGFNGMYQQNTNRGEEQIIPDYELFDAGIFAITARSFQKVTISAGIRGDMRSMDLAGSEKEGVVHFRTLNRNFSNITGSAGITWQPTGKLNIKLNVARGFRAPTASELASNGAHEGTYRYEYGDPNLSTEGSWQADAGVEFSSDHFSLGLSTFYNRIDNFIFYQRLSNSNGSDSLVADDHGTLLQAFQYRQNNAALWGMEAKLDFHPHPLDWLHIENTFSYVAGSFSNRIEGVRYLPFIPPARLLSEIRGNFSKAGKCISNLYAKAEIEWTAPQNRVFTAYNTETVTPGYTLLNLGAGADFTARGKTLFSVYASVNNLTDVAFQNHLSRLKYTDVNNATGRQGIFNMGRSVTVKLNIPLQWQ